MACSARCLPALIAKSRYGARLSGRLGGFGCFHLFAAFPMEPEAKLPRNAKLWAVGHDSSFHPSGHLGKSQRQAPRDRGLHDGRQADRKYATGGQALTRQIGRNAKKEHAKMVADFPFTTRAFSLTLPSPWHILNLQAGDFDSAREARHAGTEDRQDLAQPENGSTGRCQDSRPFPRCQLRLRRL